MHVNFDIHAGLTVGFLNTLFSVLESNGQLNIQVGVTAGSLQVDIVIPVHYSIVQSNSTSGM